MQVRAGAGARWWRGAVVLAAVAQLCGASPDGRDAESLGATLLTRESQLFPLGEAVNYVVLGSIASDDARIAGAVRDWEQKTCFRFRKCRSEGSCPRPYIRFHAGSGCSSPLGRTRSGVNTISLARGCGLGAAVHEFGHSLGLSHEQSRKDRDSHVRVDFSQVRRGVERNFQKNPASGRDLGRYDYGSVMHYGPRGFAIGRRPTIVAPQPIGQRGGLSEGDVAAIEFMYNGCSPTFLRPRCLASVDANTTHVVKPSATFALDFNALYDSSRPMRVSYGGTTVPAAQVRHVLQAGATITGTGFAEVQFTPTAGMAGQEYTLSATFTGSDGPAATCTVRVRVEGDAVRTAAPTAAPTNEPTAAPTNEPTAAPTSAPTAAPTTEPTTAPTNEPTAAPTNEPTAAPTHEPTAAPTAAPTNEPTAAPTSAPTTAPTNAPTSVPSTPAPRTPHPTTSPATPQPQPQPTRPPTGGGVCLRKVFGFNTRRALHTAGAHVQLSRRTKRWGAGSMMIQQTQHSSYFKVRATQAARFSVYARVESDDARLGFRLHSPTGSLVEVLHAVHGGLFSITYAPPHWGGWVVSPGGLVLPRTFQRIVVAFDWASRTYDVSIDGRSVGSGDLPDGFDAIENVQITAHGAAPVWVDRMQLLCR